MTGCCARALAVAERSDARPAAPIQFAADYLGSAGQNTCVALGNRAADRLIAAAP